MGAAFRTSMGTTSVEPDILLFKRFRDHWNFIDQAKFETADADEVAKAAIAEARKGLLYIAMSQSNQVRDDCQ